jgi:hypothetical protein
MSYFRAIDVDDEEEIFFPISSCGVVANIEHRKGIMRDAVNSLVTCTRHIGNLETTRIDQIVPSFVAENMDEETKEAILKNAKTFHKTQHENQIKTLMKRLNSEAIIMFQGEEYFVRDVTKVPEEQVLAAMDSMKETNGSNQPL